MATQGRSRGLEDKSKSETARIVNVVWQVDQATYASSRDFASKVETSESECSGNQDARLHSITPFDQPFDDNVLFLNPCASCSIPSPLQNVQFSSGSGQCQYQADDPAPTNDGSRMRGWGDLEQVWFFFPNPLSNGLHMTRIQVDLTVFCETTNLQALWSMQFNGHTSRVLCS